MAQSNTIMINYKIELPNGEFSYIEFFKPFSNKELKNKDDSNFFNEEISIDLDEIFDRCVEYVPQERILPKTPNILLDMIYACSNIYPYLYFIDYPFFYYGYINDYLRNIGLYTELIKQDIYNLKRDLSLLINAYFFESDDKYLNSSFRKLKEKNHIDFKIQYQKKESIKDAIYYLCNLKNISTKQTSVLYKIDLTKVDNFISLLRKLKTKDFFKDHGCFCLVKADNAWYFSISGTNPGYDSLGKNLEHDISQYFKHSKFTYCGLADNVLSYGDIVINNILREYKTPIPYSKAKTNFPLERLKDEFKCCERKIFPVISSERHLIVICKYDPCPRCIPAVCQEKQSKQSFIFKSFAHDYDDFVRYLNREKSKLIHKLQLGIINDI